MCVGVYVCVCVKAGAKEAPAPCDRQSLRLSDPAHIRWLPGVRQTLLPEACYHSLPAAPPLPVSELIDLERSADSLLLSASAALPLSFSLSSTTDSVWS